MLNILSLVISSCLWLSPADSVNMPPIPRHKFTVITHRGDHEFFPENTLAAYRKSIKDGADYIEIDLRTTKDGVLVSMHDETVNKMTGSSGLVRELTYSELQKLKVSSQNKGSTKTEAIPTFNEILDLCKDKIYIYIDFKAADPAYVYKILKKHKMEHQVLVYINEPVQFIGWRAAAPLMPIMLSLPDNVKDLTGMREFVKSYHPDILDGDLSQYTPEMVTFAEICHIPVWPDGQSSSEGKDTWHHAISIGLNGLQSDHPIKFIAYLKAMHLR